MSYEDFKNKYVSLFNKMMSYPPTQAGAGIYAEKLADMAEEYPEYEERLENEGLTT